MIIQLVSFIILILILSIYKVNIFKIKKQPKLALIYSCLMLICLIIGCFLFTHSKIPSSTIPFRIIFEPIGKIILSQ